MSSTGTQSCRQASHRRSDWEGISACSAVRPTSSEQLLPCFPEGIVDNPDRCGYCLPESNPSSIRWESQCDSSQTSSVLLKMLCADSSSAYCKEMIRQQATRDGPTPWPTEPATSALLTEARSSGSSPAQAGRRGSAQWGGRRLARHRRVARGSTVEKHPGGGDRYARTTPSSAS